MEELYIYQVARIRCRELTLFSKQDIDSLLATKDFGSALRLLFDKGMGTGSEQTMEEVLEAENKKLWGFIDELLKDKSAFEVLMLPADYNNLKAAIKSLISKTALNGIYKEGGTVKKEVIIDAVNKNDFSKLPADLKICAQVAYDSFLETHDGQMCDSIVDSACLRNIISSAKKSGDNLLKDYANLYVTLANLKIAIRCQKTRKKIDFIEKALVETDLIDVKNLVKAAASSEEDLMNLLSRSEFAKCVDKIRESNSAFEKWCDDKIMELVKKQKVNSCTIGPIVAYVVARQTELNTVKIILSAKLNELNSESIKERLRDMYV